MTRQRINNKYKMSTVVYIICKQWLIIDINQVNFIFLNLRLT